MKLNYSKTILYLVFPIIYWITILLVHIIDNENLRQGIGFWGSLVTIPTNYLVYLITDILNLNDSHSLIENGIAGTIQYSIIIPFIVKLFGNKNREVKVF